MARQYFVEVGQPQRRRFIGRRQSYHGNTLCTLAAGGDAARRATYAPLLSEAFSHVTPPFAYRYKRDDETEAEFSDRLVTELEAEFQRLGPETVAAVVAEPVACGCTVGSSRSPSRAPWPVSRMPVRLMGCAATMCCWRRPISCPRRRPA
jgi:adenosylmethionine-8-amino-7-oxononanoate aminotransferase